MGLALQPAARRDLVDVAVNVDLQQRARMIGWTSSRFWNHTVKAQRPEIQLIDKHVDHPPRLVLTNVVIQILGKQNALYTVFTLDEARHLTPRRESSRIITQQAFSHSLGGERLTLRPAWRISSKCCLSSRRVEMGCAASRIANYAAEHALRESCGLLLCRAIRIGGQSRSCPARRVPRLKLMGRMDDFGRGPTVAASHEAIADGAGD